ncbi:hypothetical protein L2E82_20308 [Cichorium intybus]|uniref:Uncharacterized protein n=1 Tax=Cichorium intybus TaxID=13427 RepID=A0ACB9DSZ8_CICIN|nr:hypothetical protein L2E82_20308 [Cichorium intybus]
MYVAALFALFLTKSPNGLFPRWLAYQLNIHKRARSVCTSVLYILIPKTETCLVDESRSCNQSVINGSSWSGSWLSRGSLPAHLMGAVMCLPDEPRASRNLNFLLPMANCRFTMDNSLPTPALILRTRQMQMANLICLLMVILTQRRLSKKKSPTLPTKEVILRRQRVREEVLHDLSNGGKCRELIRMSLQAFKKLCTILQRDGGLRPTQRMSVEEHVARFLQIVGNDLRVRFASWIYRRSKSTTSRCFHRVLRAVISLESRYIQQPKGDVVPKEIKEKKRFYPYFKNCIGAIDGTHVRVKVANKDAPRYRGRKGYPTINVLAACSFDLKFTYVLTGWEGTASDSRILKNALNREDKLVIPTGRYCLVDAGLPHTGSLMTPYRGVRYHLKEYSARAPENARELFNLRHASLRNAIERAFGVLKRRFPIIRKEDRDKALEDEVLQELLNGPIEEVPPNSRVRHDASNEAEQLRDSIANQMWTNYLLHPNNEIDMSK